MPYSLANARAMNGAHGDLISAMDRFNKMMRYAGHAGGATYSKMLDELHVLERHIVVLREKMEEVVK